MKNITTALLCTLFSLAFFSQNDLCTDTIAVSCGDTLTGSTTAATSTGATYGSSGTSSGASTVVVFGIAPTPVPIPVDDEIQTCIYEDLVLKVNVDPSHDHLKAQKDIIKAEIYNRYDVKVFELNDYINNWCGQDASDGNLDSDELFVYRTYFYVI